MLDGRSSTPVRHLETSLLDTMAIPSDHPQSKLAKPPTTRSLKDSPNSCSKIKKARGHSASLGATAAIAALCPTTVPPTLRSSRAPRSRRRQAAQRPPFSQALTAEFSNLYGKSLRAPQVQWQNSR